jgi:hypothetical protein
MGEHQLVMSMVVTSPPPPTLCGVCFVHGVGSLQASASEYVGLVQGGVSIDEEDVLVFRSPENALFHCLDTCADVLVATHPDGSVDAQPGSGVCVCGRLPCCRVGRGAWGGGCCVDLPS